MVSIPCQLPIVAGWPTIFSCRAGAPCLVAFTRESGGDLPQPFGNSSDILRKTRDEITIHVQGDR